MAAPTGAHVLLETVALHPDENQPFVGVGSRQAHGDPDGGQRQKLLAPVTVNGDANRDDE